MSENPWYTAIPNLLAHCECGGDLQHKTHPAVALFLADVHVQERKEPGAGVDGPVRRNLLPGYLPVQERHGKNDRKVSCDVVNWIHVVLYS